MHKAQAPPATVDAWDACSAAGPLAAFAQLHPGLQVWYTDCEDPLGILNQEAHVTRPAHHAVPPDPPQDGPLRRWVLLLDAVGLYAVDRSCGDVFRGPALAPNDQHPVLVLLAWFVHRIGEEKNTAGVAVNSFRTFYGIE